jgi:hypothetical protein
MPRRRTGHTTSVTNVDAPRARCNLTITRELTDQNKHLASRTGNSRSVAELEDGMAAARASLQRMIRSGNLEDRHS